jgi:glycosyltransferase involved in cell wall biosynthesis
MSKKYNIGLNMIVKNEEKVIKRLLDSVSKLVDWYTIIDTGSTDNTKKIIKEVMDGHGIPGEIIDHEWVNFCDARNVALKELEGKTDWGFWIDADEELIYDKAFNKKELLKNINKTKHAFVGFPVFYSGMTYSRTQFFRPSSNIRWEGAVHEIMLDETNNAGYDTTVKNIYTLVRQEGNSWGDGSEEVLRNKFLKHTELLKEYIKENDNPRWVFYLAQSYRDAKDPFNAMKWYQKRVEIEGGFWEERYVAQLHYANSMLLLKYPDEEVMDAFGDCSKYDKNRAEHFMPMISYYHRKKNWPMAYAISKYAWDHCSNNPYPKSISFIDNSVYDWKLLDLHLISLNNMDKRYELQKCFMEMNTKIKNGVVPEDQIQRLLNNNQFHIKKMGNLIA